MNANWEYQREVGQHWLDFSETHAMVVYKTAGGDYAITCYAGHGCGGEVEYADNLKSAKKLAEKKIADGTWNQLAVSP